MIIIAKKSHLKDFCKIGKLHYAQSHQTLMSKSKFLTLKAKKLKLV